VAKRARAAATRVKDAVVAAVPALGGDAGNGNGGNGGGNGNGGATL
jgi:hypothetical protein